MVALSRGFDCVVQILLGPYLGVAGVADSLGSDDKVRPVANVAKHCVSEIRGFALIQSSRLVFGRFVLVVRDLVEGINPKVVGSIPTGPTVELPGQGVADTHNQPNRHPDCRPLSPDSAPDL